MKHNTLVDEYYSAYATLGWISLEKVVFVKKLLFFRSICILNENIPCRGIMLLQANKYHRDRAKCRLNESSSPMFEILNVAERTGLIDVCFNMILNGHLYSKKDWNKIIWERVWTLEDEEHQVAKAQLNKERLLWQIIESPNYLTWWVLSDISRNNIEQFEIMARLVCGSSLLKECNPRYKTLSIASRFCEKCDLGIKESVRHIFMQCPYFENDKQTMFTELGSIEDEEVRILLQDPAEIFLCLLGKHPINVSFEAMYKLWIISAKHLSSMYKRVILDR